MASSLSLFASLALALAAAAPAPAAKALRPLVPDDLYRFATVSEPRLSPDGAWVAYVVTTSDREADEQRSALWMVSWDGKERLPLTGPNKGLGSPRWRPDGGALAFVTMPAGAKHPQLAVLDRRGGEAQVLTALNDELVGFAWAPDGKRLALVLEQSGEDPVEAAKRPAGAPPPPKPIVLDALHFKHDIDGYLGEGHGRHLYLFEPETKALVQLTTDPAFNESLPVWSPDGTRLAFVRTHEKGTDADGRAEIAVVEAKAGAAPRALARPFAPNDQKLAFSPDGKLLAFLQGQEPRLYAYMQDQLVVLPSAGGAPRVLTEKLDRAVHSFAFAADSASITLTVEDDGTDHPARLDLASGSITPLVKGPFSVTAPSIAGTRTAVLYSDDTAPTEVYALESGKLRKLTGHNDALLAELQLGPVEELRFKSKDGTEVHGFAVGPPGMVPGKRYPTVLIIHGGPNGQDSHSLSFDGYLLRRHELAARGFVVLGVNYRGSSGRGAAFARAIVADWGHLEVEDLLAAVDHAVAKGLADPERLGIGGWSYGGILTDYTIATDGRFKAAWSGAGSANQLSMYGSDQYIGQYNAELGPPWKSEALWLKLSYPFFHADRIKTPTLFMGGDQDFNVPVAGGEQMYQALRTLGVPTQMVVYPGQNHIFTRPSFIKDRQERLDAWFARYLLPAK